MKRATTDDDQKYALALDAFVKGVANTRYEELHFRSPSGFNELIQISRIGAANL